MSLKIVKFAVGVSRVTVAIHDGALRHMHFVRDCSSHVQYPLSLHVLRTVMSHK